MPTKAVRCFQDIFIDAHKIIVNKKLSKYSNIERYSRQDVYCTIWQYIENFVFNCTWRCAWQDRYKKNCWQYTLKFVILFSSALFASIYLLLLSELLDHVWNLVLTCWPIWWCWMAWGAHITQLYEYFGPGYFWTVPSSADIYIIPCSCCTHKHHFQSLNFWFPIIAFIG